MRTQSASTAVATNLVRRSAESLASASASNRTDAKAGADCDMDELLLVDLADSFNDPPARMRATIDRGHGLHDRAHKVDDNVHLLCGASLELFQGIGHI